MHPKLPAMARLCPDAFPSRRPWQDIAPMRSRRGLGREKHRFVATFRRHVSEMSWFWQDMRAVHPKSPANSRLGDTPREYLAAKGPFSRPGPSNHARRANLAIVRRMSEKEPGKA